MRDKRYLNCPDSHKLSRRAGHGDIDFFVGKEYIQVEVKERIINTNFFK